MESRRPDVAADAVGAMLAGAFLGALMVLHSGLVWPLVVAAASTIAITLGYALHPSSAQAPDPKASAH